MTLRLSLTQRFVLLISLLIVGLLAGSYAIQAGVVRDGLVDLFERRLSRCRVVLDQYVNVHRLTRAREMDAVLSSPRFLAAVGTQDSATIAGEVPAYAHMLGADFFLVAGPDGEIVFASVSLPADTRGRLGLYLMDKAQDEATHYVKLNDEFYEVVASEVETPDGYLLGRMAIGRRFASKLADDLSNLTGFDIVIDADGRVVGSTDPQLAAWMSGRGDFGSGRLSGPGMARAKYRGQEIVYLPVDDAHFNATITFVGFPDLVVAPIQAKITLWLIVLATVGGLLALAVIYTITERRIGRQVDLLVKAADRIRDGDLDFSIRARSHDELGYLADEFEKMRASLRRHRSELVAEHQARLQSERLATIGRLATGIIHDLRNPMAIIRGNVDVVRMKEGDASPMARHYRAIQSQVDRMGELAQDILEFSKGRTRLERVDVPLQSYFEEIVDGQRASFEESHVRLVLAPSPPVTACIDPARFRRVVDNLLVNARQALGTGGCVTVGWRTENDLLLVNVEDDGPGIPESIRDSLFDPFVTSGKAQGTGLGLAITQKVVEDHGGRIGVETDPSWGTRFTITLPLTATAGVPREESPA